MIWLAILLLAFYSSVFIIICSVHGIHREKENKPKSDTNVMEYYPERDIICLSVDTEIPEKVYSKMSEAVEDLGTGGSLIIPKTIDVIILRKKDTNEKV